MATWTRDSEIWTCDCGKYCTTKATYGSLFYNNNICNNSIRFRYYGEQLLWYLSVSSNVSYSPSRFTIWIYYLLFTPPIVRSSHQMCYIKKRSEACIFIKKRLRHRIPSNTTGRLLLLCVTTSLLENFLFYIKLFRKFASR